MLQAPRGRLARPDLRAPLALELQERPAPRGSPEPQDLQDLQELMALQAQLDLLVLEKQDQQVPLEVMEPLAQLAQPA